MSDLISGLSQGIFNIFDTFSDDPSRNPNLAYDAANKKLEEILGLYSGLSVPEIRQAVAEQAGPNAFDSISVDPATRDYQMRALQGLGNEVNTKGLTAEDIAAQTQALANAGRMESGLRGAAEQRAAARGLGGAMSSQLADLQASQAGINQANNNAVDIAGQNRQRYMQALAQMGSQAGAVRGQDWQQAAQRAAAQNQMNEFNAGMRWNAQEHNLKAPQQQFQDAMALAQAKGGVMSQEALNAINKYKAQHGQRADAFAGFGKAGDSAIETGMNFAGGM